MLSIVTSPIMLSVVMLTVVTPIFTHYIQLKSLLGMNTQAYSYRVSMAVTHGVTVIKISSSLTIRKK